ncbi:hypothetical protein EAF04_009110 [Stromatinia cepivora]|nr:hypothetical protein EAF04_009110 [Stromatinia cepivora]
MFGQKEEDIKSLTTVTCYYSLSPPGLNGLQFHFENGSLVPDETLYGGRGVGFCIDGPGGEILSGVDVFWSDETECLGISFLTNRGRRSAFNQSIINEKFAVERLLAPPGTLIIGVYVDITHVDQYQPNWKGFGLICVPSECSSPLGILPELQEYPLLDDHFNMWTGDSIPIPGYLCGETIGSQPSNGFTNWVCFDNGIKKLKYQLDCRSSSQSNSRCLVNPVSDVIASAFSMLSINGQRGPGPHLVIRDDENISEITVVSGTVGNIPRIFEIKLETDIGAPRNIFTEAAGDRGINQEREITLKSSSSLILVGLAWSFDLGLLRPAMHGLQPIYKLRDGVEHPDIQSTLYPKMNWAKPPPVDLQLRPVPAMQSNMSSLESSVPSHSSNHRRLSASSTLVLINVFFNGFLQGIEFFYQDGLKETVGNLIGSSHQIVLGTGESIFPVQFYERVQCIFSDASYPRDVMCVEGISVSGI